MNLGALGLTYIILEGALFQVQQNVPGLKVGVRCAVLHLTRSSV